MWIFPVWVVTEKAARSNWEDTYDPTEDLREPTKLNDFSSPTAPPRRGSRLLKEEDRQISEFQYLETDKGTRGQKMLDKQKLF